MLLNCQPKSIRKKARLKTLCCRWCFWVIVVTPISTSGSPLLPPNPEEARIAKLAIEVPQLDRAVSRFCAPFIDELISPLWTNDEAQVQSLGIAVWRAARASVQSGLLDDRLLYWCRLTLASRLSELLAQSSMALTDAEALLKFFDQASRGLHSSYWNQSNALQVLITGFDPFSLDKHIDQSNPSGLAALALDGKILSQGEQKLEIKSAMFPVRYRDFDQGLLETWLTPLLENRSVDLMLTVSMGRDGFDLERFPGKRRSAAAPDNLGVFAGGSGSLPIIPLLVDQTLSGPEFVEFRLPVESMLGAEGLFDVRDNREVATLEQGVFRAKDLVDLASQTAVRGSGGGYLSNEISYRSIRLTNALGVSIPIGHIHTPRMEGYNPEILQAILDQVQQLILLAASPSSSVR